MCSPLADPGRRCHDDEMAETSGISPADLAELIERMDEAAAAYIRGDIRHYLSLSDHPEDYTLMPPYGGETARGYAPTDAQIEETSAFFASGEATLDVAETYVSGNLAVLVAVERQHGVVGGAEDQDWSLRVTLVFRRVGDRWQLVHRHADPLVREIPWDLFAQIARGDVRA
jgi:ketosteroid isomerase-like protein